MESISRAAGYGVLMNSGKSSWPAVPQPQLPVGSRVLPPWQRRRLARLHRFAALVRLVSCGNDSEMLDRLEGELNQMLAGNRVHQSIINDLRHGRRRYPGPALRHIVAAGRQDQLGTIYRHHDHLAAYCELSGGSLGTLTVHALTSTPDHATVAIATRICSAARLMTICGSVAEDASEGRCYVPTADLEFHRVRPEDVIDNLPGVSRSVSQVVSGLAARAFYDLQEAASALPRASLPVRCGLAGFAAEAVELHRQMQRSHFDVLRPPAQIRRRQAARRLPKTLRGRI